MLHSTEAPRLSNSQNSKISFGYVDFYAKSFQILYPSLENSTTGIAIVFNSNWIDFYIITD